MPNRLKKARFFARKSQGRLFLETGIHYATICRIECGYQKPTPDQKKKLARALKVKVNWLFPKDIDERN
jgi:transcriptional regulator with XRE-family HTH domain